MDMTKKNLIAEHSAIENYREMIVHIGNDDPPTRRLLEGILANRGGTSKGSRQPVDRVRPGTQYPV